MRRMRGAVIGRLLPYADVGPFEAVVAPHPYLACYECGSRLSVGPTPEGAVLIVCRTCKVAVDDRRVA